MTHDVLCVWYKAVNQFSPTSVCWECEVIARVRNQETDSYIDGQESIRLQFYGENCSWVTLGECANGIKCLSCHRLNALVNERRDGYMEGRRDAAREVAVHKPATTEETIAVILGDDVTELPHYLGAVRK